MAASLIFPWRFMLASSYYLPGTILSLVSSGKLSTLFSWFGFQAVWFSRFWGWAGPQVRSSAEIKVVPLLEGRVSAGDVLPSGSTHQGVGGTVLEIGPGSGMWVSIFSDKYLGLSATKSGSRSKVTRVYGVEPNAGVHAGLRAQIAAAGLEDMYEIVPVGIEDLERSGRVERESVDCIVSVLCLCSIPNPQHNITELYSYLKPGGRWFVYEHVKCAHWQGRGIAAYQALMNYIWPHFIGGCELRRDTGKWLREAGPWSVVDLTEPIGQPWFIPLPHVIGVLTK
ncbi:S-adenosyl-L-methionine-dependent methyltransferase [Podospora didyma]|uniref:S-adenosyl-L-methionine-dependent methyltransferase n=1 Tax=Podospora didyma TaxID=330526 RepID=A0AAE0KJ92_9PEZI|nr:S-adenosyl-L-methionine-dependent methyltransferase [Podospora didyma]